MTSLSKLTLVVHEERSQRLKDVLSEVFPQQSERITALFEGAKLGINLEVSRKKKSRSRPQENYFRKWERGFAEFCGLTQDEMHDELLRRSFGSEEVETRFGIKTRPVQRSTRSSPAEYSELIETLIIVAAEMGFAIPPPPSPEEYEEYANG
jgi:hypothetical protein